MGPGKNSIRSCPYFESVVYCVVEFTRPELPYGVFWSSVVLPLYSSSPLPLVPRSFFWLPHLSIIYRDSSMIQLVGDLGWSELEVFLRWCIYSNRYTVYNTIFVRVSQINYLGFSRLVPTTSLNLDLKGGIGLEKKCILGEKDHSCYGSWTFIIKFTWTSDNL